MVSRGGDGQVEADVTRAVLMGEMHPRVRRSASLTFRVGRRPTVDGLGLWPV